MREFFRRITGRAEDRWSGLDQTVRFALIGVAAALAVSLIVWIILAQRGDYVTLYSGLTPQETGGIVGALEKEKIDYQISDDQSEIQVKVQDIDHARRISADAQLSGSVSMFGQRTLKRKDDLGYEILKSGTLQMMSREEFREFRRQALEGELARTLSTFRGVHAASVKLSIPTPQPFVRDQEEPKASVTLELLPSNIGAEPIDVDTIRSIQRVVAYTVPGLLPENVHVVDQNGLYDSDELISPNKTAADKSNEVLQIKEDYEKHYLKKLNKSVEVYNGYVKIAGIEVDVNLTDTVTKKVAFEPSLKEDGTGVIRSKLKENESFEGTGSAPGGEAGVESNLFPPEYETYQSGSAGPSTYDKSREILNYEMDQIQTEEKSMPTFSVKSAAVIVDLSLSEEVDSIKNIIANTSGVEMNNISVELAAFPVVKEVSEALAEVPLPIWTQLAQMIVIALTVIAILIFLRSWLGSPATRARAEEISAESPTVTIGEEHLPKGLTVKDYIDRHLAEQFTYLKREFEEAHDQRETERQETLIEEERVRVQEKEEREKQETIEAEKRVQEEGVLREEAEQDRRKDVLDQARQFADREPDAVAQILRSWLTEDLADDKQDQADQEGNEE